MQVDKLHVIMIVYKRLFYWVVVFRYGCGIYKTGKDRI